MSYALPASRRRCRLRGDAAGFEATLPASRRRCRLRGDAAGFEATLPASRRRCRLRGDAAGFEATLRFYCDGLGLRLKARWEEDSAPTAMLEAGGGTYLEVYGAGTSQPSPGGPALHIAFCTPNCDTALQQALNAGTTLIDKPRNYNIEARPQPFRARLAYCAGPDGEMIEFIESPDL